MRIYIATTIIMLAVGIGFGLFLGWIQFPREYEDGYLCQLDPAYQESYTIMVARGYRQDADDPGDARDLAFERLQLLLSTNDPACAESTNSIDNVPLWVQTVTEKYISISADRSIIEDLVALSAAFGRVTPLMENFLPEQS